MRLISFIKSLFKKKLAKEVYYRYAELSEDAKAMARSAKNTEMVTIQEKLGWTPRLTLSKMNLENLINRFEVYENDWYNKQYKQDGSLK